jgi:hypothetical protein
MMLAEAGATAAGGREAGLVRIESTADDGAPSEPVVPSDVKVGQRSLPELRRGLPSCRLTYSRAHPPNTSVTFGRLPRRTPSRRLPMRSRPPSRPPP